MRQQHEITTSAPLLGKDGDLLDPSVSQSGWLIRLHSLHGFHPC